METIHQSFQVTYQYPVHFTTNLFRLDNRTLRDVALSRDGDGPGKVLCVVERAVVDHHPSLLAEVAAYCRHHGEALSLVAAPLVVGGGEAIKESYEVVSQVHRAVHTHGVCRHSYVMAIGGGGLLDAVGYAAATAHRGVRLIRVPTTVLAQGDSGVGVKNGINAYGKKNFIGAFAPPAAVLIDFSFLPTLPDREWRSGIAEAVKVALIKDATFFDSIEAEAGALVRRDMDAMRCLVYRCAQIHLTHIATSGDPFESGSSRPLDFGHWAAHKLESLTGFRLLHGEAVAIGVALDSTYSHLVGLLGAAEWLRILRVLSTLGFSLHVPELSAGLTAGADGGRILDGLDEFREHLGGRLTVMLLRGIGRGVEVNEINHDTVAQSVAILDRYQSSRKEREHGPVCRDLSPVAAADR